MVQISGRLLHFPNAASFPQLPSGYSQYVCAGQLALLGPPQAPPTAMGFSSAANARELQRRTAENENKAKKKLRADEIFIMFLLAEFRACHL